MECSLLGWCQSIVPSFNIHHSCWWFHLRCLRWFRQKLILNKRSIWILRNPIFGSRFLFSFDKKRAESSSFFSWSVIILQKLIKNFITYFNFEFLILEIWFFSSFLFNLSDVFINLAWNQRIHHLPEEFSFWKFLFFSIWIWKILNYLWGAWYHWLITVLDRKFRPRRDFLSRNIFLKKNSLSLIKNILNMFQTTVLQSWHQIT